MTDAAGDQAAEDRRLRDRREAVAAQARARRGRVRAAALAGVAALAVLTGLALSPLLQAREIDVHGADGARAEAVHERASASLGEPLALIDTGAAAERVAALSWVGEAAVERSPPSTLVVRVTEREPLLVLEAASGSWLVDRDAVVIGGGAQEGLPRVAAPEAEVRAGQELDSEGAREAVAVVAALAEGVRERVAHVEVTGPRGLLLRLDAEHDTAVRLGDSERLDDKVEALELLLVDLAERAGGAPGELDAVEEIDVRNPDRPVVRREGG